MCGGCILSCLGTFCCTLAHVQPHLLTGLCLQYGVLGEKLQGGFLIVFTCLTLFSDNFPDDFRGTILGQIFYQIFGQGFDQGFREGKNHEYSVQLLPGLRKKHKKRQNTSKKPLNYNPLSTLKSFKTPCQ